MLRRVVAAVGLVLALGAMVSAASALPPEVFTGVGGNNTSVTAGTANAALSAFEAGIGGANNGASPGVHPNGFRTINWDGVPEEFAEPHALSGGFFLSRGATLSTPGDSLRVSANDASSPQVFADINTTYSTDFFAFSPTRIFSPLGSVVTDIQFSPAGGIGPGTVAGFGAIFLNVRSPNTSSIAYFDPSGAMLGRFFAPIGAKQQAEFLGVLFSAEKVAKVEITSGTSPLSGATNDSPPSVNVVALDDFAYAEPQPLPAPALTIAAPAEGAVVSSASLTASGTTSDPFGIRSLTVNGQPVAVASDGSWSLPLTLTPGANTITAVATNNGGASTTVQRTVTYTQPPAPPPPTAVPPSNAFTIASVAVKANGGGTLTLTLPGRGAVALRVTAGRLGTIAQATANATLRGRFKLAFKLSKKALKALVRGSLHATATVTFTPAGGRAAKRLTSFTIKHARHGSH
jgi:glucodextranase-like protein